MDTYRKNKGNRDDDIVAQEIRGDGFYRQSDEQKK